MTGLSTSVRHTDAGPVVTVDGDLDHATAGELRAMLTALSLSAGQRLVLDLTELRFCDSSGLAVFLAVHGQVREHGASLALTGVPAQTIRVLRMTGLDEVLLAHDGDGSGSG